MENKQIKTNLIEAYNAQAEQRSRGGIEDWKVIERTHFLSSLQRENKQTLLEIGAGHGRDSLFFQEQGLKVTAIDLSPAMVDLCRKKGIMASRMDMVELGFDSNSFDAVYALNSFLHLPKMEFPIALKSVSRVLQPAGLFYLGLYGGDDFEGIWEKDSYSPKRFFSLQSDESLRNALEGVFETLYFKRIELGEENRPFQSLILRKRSI